MAVILLCDNGSVRANATLQLRRLAKGLGEKTGHPDERMTGWSKIVSNSTVT